MCVCVYVRERGRRRRRRRQTDRQTDRDRERLRGRREREREGGWGEIAKERRGSKSLPQSFFLQLISPGKQEMSTMLRMKKKRSV